MEHRKKAAIWTDQETISLITLWGEYIEVLRSHKRNKPVYAKMEADLAAKHDVVHSTFEIKTKIDNLTREYRKEIKKRNSGCSSPGWKYYDMVDSVLCSVLCQDNKIWKKGVSLNAADFYLEKNNGSTDMETGTNDSDASLHEVESEEDNDAAAVAVNVAECEKEKEGNLKNEQHKKRTENCGIKRPVASVFQNVNHAVGMRNQISRDHRTQEDEFDLLGRSLAMQLRSMPLQRALICQQKVQKVIMDERMQQLNEGTRHISSTNSS